MTQPAPQPAASKTIQVAKQTVAISGASGMVGAALAAVLSDSGHRTLSIARKVSDSDKHNILWDPASGLKNPSQLTGVDTIVHLAGENIAAGRWTTALKDRIRRSRVEGTRNLVKSMGAVSQRPKTLVCASAVGYYGDRGDTVLDDHRIDLWHLGHMVDGILEFRWPKQRLVIFGPARRLALA